MQSLRGKIELMFHQDISNKYDEMKYMKQSGKFFLNEILLVRMLRV